MKEERIAGQRKGTCGSPEINIFLSKGKFINDVTQLLGRVSAFTTLSVNVQVKLTFTKGGGGGVLGPICLTSFMSVP
jgi:hypothetical protein